MKFALAAGRIVRALSIAGILAATACGDRATDATGALAPGRSRLSVAPSFEALPPGFPGVTLSRIRGVLIGPAGDSTIVMANFVGDSAVLTFDVRFQGESANFILDLTAFDNQSVAAYHAAQTITVRAGNNTIVATPQLVYVAPDAGVTTLHVTPAALTLNARALGSLSAAGTNSAGQAVSPIRLGWSSNDPTVATVDANGAVHAGQFQGTAYVVARTALNVADSALISVHAPVDHIDIVPSTLQVPRGLTAAAGAELRDAGNHLIDDRTATWRSSDPSVATISSTGVVSGIKLGTATITATAEGKSGSAVVTVVSPIDHIQVTPATLTFASLGESRMVTAQAVTRTGASISGVTVQFSSSNPAIATVDTNGKVTAVANGSTTIKASADGVEGVVNVTVLQIAVSIAISPKAAGVTFLNDKRTFTAIASDAQGSPVATFAIKFSSSDPTVVTIDSAGVATPHAVGTATIRATFGTKSDSAAFTVAQTPSLLSVTSDHSQIIVGATAQLTGRLVDAGGSPLAIPISVNWGSRTPTVASVSSTGLVTGRAPGTAVITAASSGFTTTTTVVVVRSPGDVPGSARGLVLDANRNVPIAGATISGGSGATSGSDGTFVVTNVPTEGTLTIAATGFISARYFAVDASEGQAQLGTIPLAPLSTQTGTVTGKVIDAATGLPVSGASIVFISGINSNGEGVSKAITDTTGTYSAQMPAGTYTAIAFGDDSETSGSLALAAIGGTTHGNQNISLFRFISAGSPRSRPGGVGAQVRSAPTPSKP